MIQGSGSRCVVTCVLALQVAVLVGCSQDPATRRQQFLDSGNRYFDQTKYQEAIVEYRNAVQADSASGPARLRLAQAYERIGDGSNALAQYVRAADLLPTDASVQLKAGNYLLSARQFDDAKARAEAVLSSNDRNVEAQVLLGNALAGLRNIEQAIEEMEQAIRLDPARGATYANLGVLENARGRTESAEAAFKQAIVLDQKWVPAYLALANSLWSRGAMTEAERVLLDAQKLEPTNPLINRALTVLYVTTKRGPRAEPYVKSLAASGREPFALADYYLFENRADAAIAELQQRQKDPNTVKDASERLAQAYASKKDFVAAHREIDALLRQNPADAKALLLKGQVLEVEGKRKDALAKLNASARVDPNSAPLQFSLGRAYAAEGDADRARRAYHEVLRLNPRAAEAQVQLARLELVGGRADSSIHYAREALRTEPTNLDAQMALVRGLLATRDIAGAGKALEPLLKSQPKSAAVQRQYGFLLTAKRDLAGAKRAFEAALAADPDDADALDGLAMLDASAGNIAGARARIDAQIAARPDAASLRLVAARADAKANDIASAERQLRKAVELDPSLLAGYAMLGQLYVVQRKLDNAREELERLAQRQPKPIAAVTMLGMIAQAQNDGAAARRHFERVVDLDPTAAVAANNLAWLYADSGQQLDRALQLAQVAVERLPKAAEVRDTLGWVHYKRKSPELAQAAFGEAAKLAPGNPTYHYHLGLAFVQGNDPVSARATFERALALKVPFAGQDRVRQQLASLPPAPAASR